MLSNELARRYGDQGIVSTAVNPGNIKSDIQRHLPAVQKWILVSKVITLYKPPFEACWKSAR